MLSNVLWKHALHLNGFICANESLSYLLLFTALVKWPEGAELLLCWHQKDAELLLCRLCGVLPF